MPRAISSGWSRWTRRSTELISTPPTRRVLTSPQGATANHNKRSTEEPDEHAIWRSRGGLDSKTHAAVVGNGVPLAIVLAGGQRHDGAMRLEVLDDIRGPRLGSGRHRIRPDA